MCHMGDFSGCAMTGVDLPCGLVTQLQGPVELTVQREGLDNIAVSTKYIIRVYFFANENKYTYLLLKYLKKKT